MRPKLKAALGDLLDRCEAYVFLAKTVHMLGAATRAAVLHDQMAAFELHVKQIRDALDDAS